MARRQAKGERLGKQINGGETSRYICIADVISDVVGGHAVPALTPKYL